MRPASTLRSQIGREIFRLFGTYVIGVTALIVLLAIYGIHYHQKEAFKHYKTLVMTRLSYEISATLRQAKDLTESTAVWTGLTDSGGRGTYWLPLLLKANENPLRQYDLLDYRGRAFIHSTSGLLTGDLQSLQQTVQDGQMHFETLHIGRTDELVVSLPITAHLTDGLAGILVARLDLGQLLQSLDLPQDMAIGFGMKPADFEPTDFSWQKEQFRYTWSEAGRELSFEVQLQQSSLPALVFVLMGLAVSMVCAGALLRGLKRWTRDFSKRTTQRLEALVQLANNTLQGLDVQTPSDLAGDEVSQVSSTLHGILQRQRQITQQLQVFSRVFETAAEGILITNTQGMVVDVNAALMQMTGYTKLELRDRPAGQLYHHSQAPQASTVPDIASSVRERGSWRGETFFLNKHREPIPVLLSVSTLRDAQGKHLGHVSVLTDIRPMRQAEQRLKDLLNLDPLTGLPNYRAFLEFMHTRMQGGRFALLFIDMDHFKHINDTFGHDQGDEVIRQIAQHLQAHLPAGHFLCRRSGDEFMAVVDVDNSDQAFQKSLQAVFKETVFSANHQDAVQVSVTFSAGAALFPDHSEKLQELLIYADTALLQAKESGRNRIEWLNASLLAATSRKSLVEAKLAVAIQAQKILPWYQPEVDLETGQIIGFEALARWHDEALGMVAPGEFIPLAEQSGAIDPLTQSMFAQVVRDSQLIRARFPGAVMALNSSPQLLSGRRLFAMLSGLALELDNGLEGFVLEITETDFAMSPQELAIQLQAIMGMGVRVAIDDFGKSYSSLSRLASMPIQKLKMDMSFVAGLEREDNLKIVSAILALAQSLGLQVTAEGVENRFQRDTLLRLGYRQAQGFGYARPMPLHDILALPPVLPGTWAS
jgi:diguanylate cyclase (GGDEF)-like protein/PAS domain S-box-containing protein